MKTYNSHVSMPWTVKVVWWWYLMLACASCVPLVFCLVKVDFRGYGELFGLLAGTASWAAYFSGLALAVRRGRRGWATNFPVLVSANLDPSQFPRTWNRVTDADRKFELARLPCADELRIGKKAVVIVRKGGASSVCKAKYCKLKHVFNGSYELGEDTYFLTPAGKVWPKGVGGAK